MNNQKSLRIMTYNVRFDVDSPPNSWEERKKLIVELIQRESPDIIGTQECLYHQVQDLITLMPEYDWVGLGREGGSNGEYAAIYFKKDRFNVLEYDHFWLSDTPNVIGSYTWGNDIPRMVSWARFLDAKTGDQFYHLNTHFDHISENARFKGSQLIIERIASLDPVVPIILTGDFNTGVDTEPHQALLKKGNLIDAWDAADNTTNDHLGSFNGFKDPSGGKERIDWILFSGNIQTASIKIVDDQPNGLFPSDHFPVVAEMRIGK
ncbi:endonuclease/exonuclease/phosphatase family protein [Lederbergia citrea]|nr:endonuclease/exonuclease/phosphatase family protein [Lederbergia citrea]